MGKQFHYEKTIHLNEPKKKTNKKTFGGWSPTQIHLQKRENSNPCNLLDI